MADLLVNLRIRAFDGVTPVVTRIRDALGNMGQFAKFAGSKTIADISAASKKASKVWGEAGDIRNAAEGVASFARTTRNALLGPLQTFEEFESQMSQVRVKMGNVSQETFQQMIDKAKELGASTRFSATEAAAGMELLAQAGFSASETMGTLPTVLNLAQAQGLDMAQASEVMTTAIRGFGLETDQASRVADVFSKAADATNADVLSLAESMSYAAPQAAALGLSIEQTSALAGILSDSGIKASRAGTALNAIFQGLTGARRGPGAKYFKALGVDAKDAEGNLRPMTDIFAQLAQKTEQFGAADKSAIFTRIFGAEASPAVNVLMNAIKTGKVESLTKAMEAAGGATQRAADIMAKDGKESTLGLKSAFEALALQAGGAVAPGFDALKRGIASVVRGIAGWMKEHPLLTKTIMYSVAAVSVFATLLAGALFTATTVFATKGLFILMGGFSGITKLLFGGTIAAVKGMAMATWGLAGKLWAAVAPTIAMAAPFIAVGLAIGAVTLAIIQLKKHWDELNIVEAWKGFKDTIGEEGLSGIWDTITLNPFSGISSDDVKNVIPGIGGSSASEPQRAAGKGKVDVGGSLKIQVEGPGRVTSVTQSGPMNLDPDGGLAGL